MVEYANSFHHPFFFLSVPLPTLTISLPPSARIDISEEESESHWQRNDYKSFSPSTDWDTVDFTKAPAIQELPVTSVVCEPLNHQVVSLDKDGKLALRGTYSMQQRKKNVI